MMATRESPSAEWNTPQRLSTPNTFGDELFPAISADGLSLFFADEFSVRSTRPGNRGGADLWVCTRTGPEATWSPPVNLGPAINSNAYDSCPAISSDGRTLFFCSNRGGGGFHLWMATRADPSNPSGWIAAVSVSELTTRFQECCPHLSPDGLTLYFSSSRPGPGCPQGQNYIWFARRESLHDPFKAPVSLGTMLPDFVYMFDPCLSPDGSELLITTRGRLPYPAAFADIWRVPLLPPPPLSISLIPATQAP
jgi:Tol biopolymer transport system component